MDWIKFVLEDLQLCYFLNLPLCDADTFGFLAHPKRPSSHIC